MVTAPNRAGGNIMKLTLEFTPEELVILLVLAVLTMEALH
jgi:hypothetical protein